MPLSEADIKEIETQNQEREILLGEMIAGRESLRALSRIHADIPDENCRAVIASAKLRIKAAADAMSAALAVTP
jgi:hypothetical protein